MKKNKPTPVVLISSPNFSTFMLNEEIDNLRRGTSDFTKDVDWRPALPLGTLYLGAELRLNSIEFEILDLHLQFYLCRCNGYFLERSLDEFYSDYLYKFLLKTEPDIVGISSLFNVSYSSVADISRVTRSINDNIKIVMGGHFPTN
jgi:hypothetical protein